MDQARARHVAKTVRRERATEGAGVSINRVMPLASLDSVDPFLLLDEIRSDDPGTYLAGFPPHPHRGIETVTYMLAGRMHHRDSTGGNGVISAGDVQWMTAARGIIHSEMPEQTDGLMWGFQLWLNMPAADKMTTMRSSYLEFVRRRDSRSCNGRPAHRVRVSRRLSFAGKRGPAPELECHGAHLSRRLDRRRADRSRSSCPDGHMRRSRMCSTERRSIAGMSW